MSKQDLDKQRLVAIALQGWSEFFSLFFTGNFKRAFMALRMSKETVHQELAKINARRSLQN